jgi:3-isopropylmalate/(R)-2-methylmalate dehydratase small subunit
MCQAHNCAPAERKEQTIMGRIWMLGDNVNTDVIIPGRYNVTTDRAQLARYCLCEVLPEFSQQVQTGDVVMAGHNFGCGSSREHAPAALLACGIQAVIARSFARIFYRNAVNIGLPVLVCEEAVLAGTDGQQIEVDLVSGIIRDAATGQTFQAEPLNPFVARIVAAGGIIEYIRQEGTLR